MKIALCAGIILVIAYNIFVVYECSQVGGKSVRGLFAVECISENRND